MYCHSCTIHLANKNITYVANQLTIEMAEQEKAKMDMTTGWHSMQPY